MWPVLALLLGLAAVAMVHRSPHALPSFRVASLMAAFLLFSAAVSPRDPADPYTLSTCEIKTLVTSLAMLLPVGWLIFGRPR